MADFKPAFARLKQAEGGYSNKPAAEDPGGETFCGISRVFHPGWVGWATIDMLRGQPDFPQRLTRIEVLMADVESFYYHEFWSFESVKDQAVAEKLFLAAVNMGHSGAKQILVDALSSRFVENYASVRMQWILLIVDANRLKADELLQELRAQLALHYHRWVNKMPDAREGEALGLFRRAAE